MSLKKCSQTYLIKCYSEAKSKHSCRNLLGRHPVCKAGGGHGCCPW